MEDRPPYIADQRMRILVLSADGDRDPRQYIKPEGFAPTRPESLLREKAIKYDAVWQPLDRHDWCRGIYQELTLLRAVLVSESGEGKSTTLEWMAARLMAEDPTLLAMVVEIDRLSTGTDIFHDVLVPNVRKQLGMTDSGNTQASQMERDELAGVLERLARRGRLVLLFDGL